jgi:hypothetical protein
MHRRFDRSVHNRWIDSHALLEKGFAVNVLGIINSFSFENLSIPCPIAIPSLTFKIHTNNVNLRCVRQTCRFNSPRPTTHRKDRKQYYFPSGSWVIRDTNVKFLFSFCRITGGRENYPRFHYLRKQTHSESKKEKSLTLLFPKLCKLDQSSYVCELWPDWHRFSLHFQVSNSHFFGWEVRMVSLPSNVEESWQQRDSILLHDNRWKDHMCHLLSFVVLGGISVANKCNPNSCRLNADTFLTSVRTFTVVAFGNPRISESQNNSNPTAGTVFWEAQ